MYSRQDVESVLKHFGASRAQMNAILDDIQFPIDATELSARLFPLGITRDALINRIGGSP
jgi:hypothetical protein